MRRGLVEAAMRLTVVPLVVTSRRGRDRRARGVDQIPPVLGGRQTGIDIAEPGTRRCGSARNASRVARVKTSPRAAPASTLMAGEKSNPGWAPARRPSKAQEGWAPPVGSLPLRRSDRRSNAGTPADRGSGSAPSGAPPVSSATNARSRRPLTAARITCAGRPRAGRRRTPAPTPRPGGRDLAHVRPPRRLGTPRTASVGVEAHHRLPAPLTQPDPVLVIHIDRVDPGSSPGTFHARQDPRAGRSG